jgi:uncharacterized protein (TIGR00106 family)
MALMEISVIPLGLGKTSIGDHIAELVKYLRREKIPHQLTDMGTQVYGDAAQLLKIAQALHELPFAQGVMRVVTHITLDDRRDKDVGLGQKTRSMESRLS